MLIEQSPVAHVSLVLGSSGLDTAPSMKSHQGRVEGKVDLPRPSGNTFPSALRDTEGLVLLQEYIESS